MREAIMRSAPVLANRSSRRPRASYLSAALIQEPEWCFLLFSTDNKYKILAKIPLDQQHRYQKREKQIASLIIKKVV